MVPVPSLLRHVCWKDKCLLIAADLIFTFFFGFTQPEFCNLTHLVKVDLSKNQLACLPDDLGNLTSLQHLDLYNNKLTLLPVSFSQLRVGFRQRGAVVCP